MTAALLWALACTDAEALKRAPLPDLEAGPPLGLPDITVRGILFIEVDTLRRDRLAQYGYPTDLLPSFAERSWHQINGHSATSAWTLPSVSSLFSSLEPARHGTLAHLEPGIPTHPFASPSWPAELGASGWTTGLFTGNRWFSENSGLSPIFQTVIRKPKEETGQANLAALLPDLIAWLDGIPEEQNFYAHLQPMDMHDPYNPPPADITDVSGGEPLPFHVGAEGLARRHFESYWHEATTDDERHEIERGAALLYDAQIPGLDRALAELMAELDSRGLLDEILVVFSADHGEMLGDNGIGDFGHGIRWHQAEAQLPLLLLGPGIEPGVSDCLSMNIDIWPTIVSMIGVPPLSDIDGIDLREACRASVRGSVWDSDVILDVHGVASTDSALNRTCRSGRDRGTPLGDDADATERTRAEKLVDGEQLVSLLGQAYADIVTEKPQAECGD